MKLCCLLNPAQIPSDTDWGKTVPVRCLDCKQTLCKIHYFKQRYSSETRCLRCFRKQILAHRVKK